MQEKEKAILWITKLETYAREQKLPARILDEIEDCRAHLEKEDLPWEELRQRIEETLESVGQKEKERGTAIQAGGLGGPSVQKVQEQLKGMAEDCHRENQDSVTAIEERKNLNIRECHRKMEEITHTEAHLEWMLDEKQYASFLQNIANDYEKDAAGAVQELFVSMGGNYTHMADRMRTMLQSIGGRAKGSWNEKFYREYESRKTVLERKLEQEAQTADFGKKIITGFAQKTGGGIQTIRKRLKHKKIILNILPLLILVAVVFGASFVKYQNTDIEKLVAEESGGAENALLGELQDAAFEKLQDTALEAIKSGSIKMPASFQAFLSAMQYFLLSLGILLIFLILLVIVAYITYLKFLGKWYRSKLCSECGDYLKAELKGFLDRDSLRKKTDEAVTHLVQEYEQQYLAFLNGIFQGTEYENAPAEDAPGYEGLIHEWELLK
ncbi:MAG: hypothetical protein NC392_15270 [Roseburia sp.]|nr:hypothetical protein [Roseburia sp.]